MTTKDLTITLIDFLRNFNYDLIPRDILETCDELQNRIDAAELLETYSQLSQGQHNVTQIT